MTSALLLLLEGLILLTLGVDLSRDFALLVFAPRAILTVLAALGALALRTPWGRRGDRVIERLRAPIAALAAGAVLVGTLGLAEEVAARRVRRDWEAGAHARLEDRARLVQGDVSWFLDELRRPIAAARLDTAEPAPAFDVLAAALSRSSLPRERLGYSIHRPDGALLAWDGNSAPAPADLLAAAGPTPIYRMAGGDASPRLYAAWAQSPGGLRWVAEFLMTAPSAARHGDERGPRFDFLPRWERAAPAHIHLRQETGQGDDLARFFDRQGDRYWGRLGHEGVTTLSFPLRAPDRTSLAVVTLRDRRADQEIGARRRRLRRAAALLTAASLLLGWILIARRTRGAGLARLLTGTVGLWSSRCALLSIGSVADLPRSSLYDVTLYASPALGGLMRSPADLLLTAAAALGQALLLRRYLGALPPPMDQRRRAGAARGTLATLVLVAAGAGLALHRLLDQMVLDARLDIGRVGFEPHALPRFALQAALFFMLSAGAIVLVALLGFAARCRGNGAAWRLIEGFRGAALRRIPLLLRVTAGVLLLTLLYLPFLYHASDRVRQSFFEDDLLPRVVHQKQRRAEILRDSAALAGGEEFAAAASFAAEGGSGSGGVAYRLWTGTPMAEAGLASSLEIFDAGGLLLDRFAVNLAPGLEIPFDRAAAAAGGEVIEVPPRPRAIVRKSVIATSRFIRPPRRPPLLVVMTVVDDYDNLPFVGADTGYVQMFRARALPRTNPELLRFEPMVAVFGGHLERLYESGGEIPPPGPLQTAALRRRGIAWATDSAGEGLVRILYGRGEGVTYALAHPHASPSQVLAGYLRLFLLNGFLAALIVALASAIRREPSFRAPGATFFGRLTAVFLLTALVPLLTLAFFVTRFSAREFARDVTTTGLGSLQVARRVAEDYLTLSSPEEAPSLDDDVVFWMSRVVRQDLNIYRDAGLLATSTRELFSSGLLNTRLDGEVYRALYLDREPFQQGRERAGGLDYQTLSAPMRIDREGTMGVISIPLAAQGRSIAHKVEEVEDAVLISTCLTVLLLAGVGYAVGRRVSEPISLLARAAQRVAEGDLDVRVRAAARDEIAILVEAFNRMAGSLRDQRADLRRRKDYIETILKSITTGVVSIDGSGSIITINSAAERLLSGPYGSPRPGESLPERLGLDATLKPLRGALQPAMDGRTEREADVVMLKGGAELRLHAVFLPFAPGEEAPHGTIILLEDVTQIVRSGRLSAWAEMARRIAHEIKNPLTPIQLSVEHIRRVWRARDERFGDVLGECLDNIQKQVRELRQIASEFSAYARLPALKPEPTPVASILEDALGPYMAAPPPGITIRSAVSPGLPAVLADRPVIARALVNVIENALHAMPGGGTLTLAASAVGGPSPTAGRVRIEIRDTGHGIDPAAMPSLFEPYFSTRSGGTGLGLAIVKKAVEDHGGTVEIQSRPGEGTVVALDLPSAGAVATGGAA